jgi:hypothetical protein
VVRIYNPPRPLRGSSVEIINASPDVITRLLVWVRLRERGGLTPQPDWEWKDHTLSSFPTVSYLLPGARLELEGAFWPPASSNAEPNASRSSVTLEAHSVEIVLTWQDSYGEVWAMRSGEEPYPSSFASPGHETYVTTCRAICNRGTGRPRRQSVSLRRSACE